jgi:hypothetical protein
LTGFPRLLRRRFVGNSRRLLHSLRSDAPDHRAKLKHHLKPAIRAQYKEKRRRSATRSPSHLLSALSCRLSPLLLGRVGCLGLLILIVLTSGYYCETGGSRTHHFRSPTTTTRPGFNTHHGSPCGVPTECLERLNLPLVSPSLMLARPGDFPPISVVERRILSTPPKGATVLSARADHRSPSTEHRRRSSTRGRSSSITSKARY